MRPQARRSPPRAGSRSRASPSHLGRGRFDPRILRDLVALARERGARILHVHGYAAADFGRLAARAAGAKLVLHEHFADPRMPAYQALADRLLRRQDRRRDRREPLDPRVPGPASASCPRSASGSSGTARRSTSSPPCPASARGASGTSWGSPTTPSSSASIGRLNAQKGHRYLVEAAARLLAHPAARPGPDRGRRGPHGRAAPAGDRPRHRRPRRLRRAPHRRARPPGRPRRVLHLVPLRGHAARALRGDGGGQGHRLDRRRRLPRGARGRGDGRCWCRPATRRPWRALSTASWATRSCARSSARSALAASRRYDVSACVDQMQELYDELLSGGSR